MSDLADSRLVLLVRCCAQMGVVMKKSKLFHTRGMAIVLTAVLSATVLTGCGKDKETSGTAGSESTQAGSGNGAEAEKLGGELNLYTWDGMFPQDLLRGFEEESGVRINYSNFDYNEDMLAKLEETKGGDYDFIIADDYILELVISEGLAGKLDTTKLANYGNYNPAFMSQFYDEKNEYTVPLGAGIPLLVYDPALAGIEITGYEDLWKPELADNIALTANYRVVNGIALKVMGESYNTEDAEVIKKAGEKMLELAPNIRVINDNNTQDFLISGEAAVGFLYTSQVSAALNARSDLKVVYPKEGLGYGVMGGFIPSNAPNADAAYAFIDYISRPEIAAKYFENLGYYCTNKAAEEFIAEEMKQFIVLPEDAASGESIHNISQEAEDLHGEIWNKFKDACD